MKKYVVNAEIVLLKDYDYLVQKIHHILGNASTNRFIFFAGSDFSKKLLPEHDLLKEFDELSKSTAGSLFMGQVVEFFVKKKDAYAKIVIEPGHEGRMCLYPLEPLCFKGGIDLKQEELDLSAYILMVIQLCENVPVFELRAEALCT